MSDDEEKVKKRKIWTREAINILYRIYKNNQTLGTFIS